MKSGETFTSESGRTWKVGPMLAYQGKPGCQDPRCTRVGANWSEGDLGECRGWHCPACDAPCSSMGHKRCQEDAA